MRAALMLVLALAAPAGAGNNELTIGSSTRALRSSSADAVTADELVGTSATYARGLDLPIMDRLTLWAEGELAYGGATGTMFQTTNTRVGNTIITAGVRARYRPYRQLAVSGRVDLGTARTSLKLDDGSGNTASDAGWGAIAAAAIAADLLAVDKPQFGFGLRLELGYIAASGVQLTPHRDSDPDTLKLPVMATSLGSLNLSGPYAGVSLLSQF